MADKGKDDDYDFFAPHPHPTKVRVKNSFFNTVPDAFSPRTLEFSEDKKLAENEKGLTKPVQKSSAAENGQGDKKAAPEPVPVEEILAPQHVTTQKANPWDETDEVSGTYVCVRLQI